MSSPTDDYLAPIEAARLLRVSPRTVLRWVRAGRIPYERSASGAPRLGREHVLRLIHPPGGGEAEDER
ncbi:MAG: excisionase family DNA-binding protein [Actinomycetota bacterium]|nr:excisionase family DNA-binding protein [Actinomycetota bacterium]